MRVELKPNEVVLLLMRALPKLHRVESLHWDRFDVTLGWHGLVFRVHPNLVVYEVWEDRGDMGSSPSACLLEELLHKAFVTKLLEDERNAKNDLEVPAESSG